MSQSDHGGKIDVHHHFRAPNSAAARPEWSVTRSLEQMDANGVDIAVAYSGPINDDAGSGKAAQSRARAINEFSADLARDNPGRFATFASLPMLDPDG